MGVAKPPVQSSQVPVPPAVCDAFLARATLMRARKSQIILSAGLDSHEVFLLLEGRAQVALFSYFGHETIIREIGENQIFGELAALDGGARSASVTAVADCRLARLGAEDFKRLLGEEAHAGLWLAQHLATQIRFLTERIYELSTLPVAGRLHCELLRLVRERGLSEDAVTIVNAPTHAELAARIGAKRESVSRELGLLGEAGVIVQVGRRIEIPSVPRLAELVRDFSPIA